MTTDSDVGYLRGHLEALTDLVKGIDKKLDIRLDRQDTRISKIENRQYYFMGGGAVIGSLLTALMGVLFK